jgi:hypothetical protein
VIRLAKLSFLLLTVFSSYLLNAADLRGSVEDTDGFAIPRAKVVLAGPQDRTVATDETGHFVVLGIADGE